MKKYLFLVLCALTVMSCVHQSGYDQYQTAKNQELVRELFKAFNKHNFKLMTSYYADTAKFLDPFVGKEYVHRTHQQKQIEFEKEISLFPNLKDSTTNIITTADQVVVQFISIGKYNSGEAASFAGCSVFKFKSGKVISEATYHDNKTQ